MTPSDSVLPGIPPVDTTLAVLINMLSIDKSPDSCDADNILTEDHILAVYKKFVVDLKKFTVVARSGAEMAEMALERMFQNAFSGLSIPYRKALDAQKWGIVELRGERDMARMEIETLRAGTETLRAEKETLRAKHEKDAANLRADSKDEILVAKEEALEEILIAKEEALEAKDDALEAKGDALEAREKLTTFLQEKLDRPVVQICVPDSVSRRETWEKVKNATGTVLDQVLPDHSDRKITNKIVEPLVTADYVDEAAMYAPVNKFVSDYLKFRRTKAHPGTQVFDTHNRYYLDGQAPDISITVQDVAEADSASVVAIIELKHKCRTPLGDDSFGQVYDYLRKLARAQPNRRKIVGLLSNLTFNHIIIHESPNHQTVNILHFATVSFAKALRFLKHCILHDSIALPSIPSFSSDLYVMEKRLGNPVFSVVGVFSIPRSLSGTKRWLTSSTLPTGDKMVVKRTSNVPPRRARASLIQSLSAVRTPKPLETRPVAAEIGILHEIRKAGGHDNLPVLIFHSNDMNEFGITPLGAPCDIYSMKQPLACTVLLEILSALEWLHGNRIIHRDVRWDNIVVVGGRGVLIDFGAAILNDGRMHEFEGGIVCAPSRVIGQFDRQYKPSPADDCLAWVLLLNALFSPTRWSGLRTDEIMMEGSDAEKRMRDLWRGLEASKTWGPGVAAAKNANYMLMPQMLDILVLL